MVTLLFLGLVINLFAWFCGTIVKRHTAFERTRSSTVDGSGNVVSPTVPFYDQNSSANKLKLFP
jgi:hypothetical protein